MISMRVAVVTGAARGIGAATVHHLAQGGWGIVAVDLCANDVAVPYPLGTLEELTRITRAYDSVVPHVGDVRDASTSVGAVQLAIERFGRLDAAVASAAIVLGGRPFWESRASDFEVLLATGLLGVANLARAAIPALLEQPTPRKGRFVAVASAAAHTGLPGLTAYGATKHAVVGLVRGLADDLAGTGVTANVVSPGSTRTPMLEATAVLYGLHSAEELGHHQAIGRLIEPEEVAAAIAWLLGEESSAMTGAVMQVDGGFRG